MKKPYLIQRAKIKSPLQNKDFTRLSQAVSMDYMGSAEFEFGALPKSFRAIEANVDLAALHVVNEIKDFEGKSLRVFAVLSTEEFEQYKIHLLALRDGKYDTKEGTRFEPDRQTDGCDFWWDIENHVMWSFNKNFMKNIHEHIAVSLNYMNEQKRKTATE